MKDRSTLTTRVSTSADRWQQQLDALNADTAARLFGKNPMMCAIAVAASYFIAAWWPQ